MTKLDYSGKPFGAPNPAPLTKSWRLKHSFLAPRAASLTTAATLNGEDSVGVSAMSSGLAVYCGYNAGTLGYANGGYTTMPEVYSRFPGKLYVSVGLDAIDIEPGLASPSQGPGFVKGAKPPHTSKPMVYCSAGDISTVISYLNGAGIPRSSYLLWSAHWIGYHICSPVNCGYPQCDGTQYDSNSSYDSDVFFSYCFGPVVPVNPWPLQTGSTGEWVTKLQQNLNKLAATLKFSPLTVDGSFGAATKAAVILAQEYFGQRGVTAGTVNQTLFEEIEYPKTPAPPVTPPPAPWTFGPVRNLAVDYKTGTVTWNSPAGFTGTPPKPAPAVDYYVVELHSGSNTGPLLKGFPAYVQKGSNPETFKLTGLTTGAVYTVGVRAANGTTSGAPSHSPAFSTVTFTYGTPSRPGYTPVSQAVATPFATVNGEIIYGFLRKSGYTPMQAAGATASMYGEGEWSPEVSGTGGNGLMGWTPPRAGIQSGNVATDMQVQLELILSFVAQNGDTGAVAQMASASTVTAAAQLWDQYVERAGIDDVHAQGVALAAGFAQKFDGVTLPQ